MPLLHPDKITVIPFFLVYTLGLKRLQYIQNLAASVFSHMVHTSPLPFSFCTGSQLNTTFTLRYSLFINLFTTWRLLTYPVFLILTHLLAHCIPLLPIYSPLLPPGSLCTLGDRTFSVAGPNLWNALPQGLYQYTSVVSLSHKEKLTC